MIFNNFSQTQKVSDRLTRNNSTSEVTSKNFKLLGNENSRKYQVSSDDELSFLQNVRYCKWTHAIG